MGGQTENMEQETERNGRGRAEEDEESAGREMEAGKEQETAGLQHCSELV